MALKLVKTESTPQINSDGSHYRMGHKLLWLFRCWHRKMSRPITRDGRTFCVCSRCGMRRNFDLQDWKMTGGYYYGRDLSEYCERAIRKETKQ